MVRHELRGPYTLYWKVFHERFKESGLGTNMDIQSTIDMAYECKTIVANPPPLDHIYNMENVEEEEEDEDEEESSTSQNP
ncbi:hypothetical protein SAY87_010294 [Trapa incisa]|uniref:Uncharacterized protein n=1 Tax=Trapa incisa TaxID=236973 RepID=A0AAN7GW42_9MYRT|nr:hypothetical protein SAY87_010294 [Trapa incisa]